MSNTNRRTSYVKPGKVKAREPRKAPRRQGTRAAVVATARREG